jgi:hypothetical protein
LVESAMVRPAATAERAMGRLRNRSTMPLQRSWASPMDVVIPPISTAFQEQGHVVIASSPAGEADRPSGQHLGGSGPLLDPGHVNHELGHADPLYTPSHTVIG